MTPLITQIRGRHAASDNMIIVGGQVIKNLSTRVSPDSTQVFLSSACEGTVCLRVEDETHSDFWLEFNLDVPTLERLLRVAMASEDKEKE
jgi:hypothetical protein